MAGDTKRITMTRDEAGPGLRGAFDAAKECEVEVLGDDGKPRWYIARKLPPLDAPDARGGVMRDDARTCQHEWERLDEWGGRACQRCGHIDVWGDTVAVDRIAELERELAAARARIAELEAELATTYHERDAFAAEANKFEAERNQARRDGERWRGYGVVLKEHIDDLTGSLGKVVHMSMDDFQLNAYYAIEDGTPEPGEREDGQP